MVMTMPGPCTHLVIGRTPGSGPVLAVLTDSPADVSVAAHAADLAARTGTLLIAAAAVHTTGHTAGAFLHHSRNLRVRTRSIAIVARVMPILHSTGVAFFRSTLLVPARGGIPGTLPSTEVRRLVDRFGAVAVVTALPLHDPTGGLQPAAAPVQTATDQRAAS